MTEIPARVIQPLSADLQPGKMSVVGFLDKGQTLEQVINRDRQALKLLGYTVREVADLLGPVTEQASNGGNFEYAAQNGKHFEVKVQTWRGSQECPWTDKVDYRRSNGGIDMYVTEKGKGGEPILIAGLIRHLVENHEFFEGGSYRVAPEKIIEMFGIERIPGSLERVKGLKI